MHFESHAGLGWTLGTLAPGSDPRLRRWVVAAAVLPDVDAVSFLFGPVAYGKYHHTFGHNVFLGALCVAAAAWRFRDRPGKPRATAAALVGVAFASHLLADMGLSAYLVYPFWPLSAHGFELATNLGLGAPINTWLVVASFVAVAVLAIWPGVTPLELISPLLDRRVRRAFSRRRATCCVCGRPCSDSCDTCGQPVCTRHGRVGRGFWLACARCHSPTTPVRDRG